MNKNANSKVVFKVLDAQLLLKRFRTISAYLVAHNTAPQAGAIAKYNLMSVELRTFTFCNGSQSLSIDNAILGLIPKRLLFTIIKNNDFLGSMDTNRFKFPHYEMDHFSLYLNGKQIPSGGLHMDNSQETTSVMAYRTLFEGSGLLHSNSGLQITHDMYVTGYFMLIYHLKPYHSASEEHTSHPDSSNIGIELKFKKALIFAITCLLCLEYYNCFRIDCARKVTSDFS